MKLRSSFSEIGNMSSRQVLFLVVAFSVCLSMGCSSRAFYESHRRDRVDECYREYEGTQRDQCLEKSEADYAEYERQRKEILENSKD